MTQTIRRPKTALPAIDDVTRREFLIGAAGLLVLPAACRDGGNEGSGRTRTFEHAMGESEVPVRPRRVASLHDTMVTYPLLDLGFEPAASAGIEGEIRAGENDVSDLEFLGQVTEPNIERIAALEPDLILGLEANNAAQYDRLSRIAPTVLMEDAPKRSLFDFHRRLADLVGRMPEYDELVARVDRRTGELKERLVPLAPELEVSAFSAFESVDGIFTYYGPSIPYSVAFERLGLRFPEDMPPSYDSGGDQLSLENLPDFDADVIFLMTNVSTEETVLEIRKQPIFASLNAAKKDQVFTVSYDEWTYARVPGILSVYDDLEKHLLDRDIDSSGDFR